jgi:hypothetical protein
MNSGKLKLGIVTALAIGKATFCGADVTERLDVKCSVFRSAVAKSVLPDWTIVSDMIGWAWRRYDVLSENF